MTSVPGQSNAALDVLNAALDAALERRVELHRDRRAGDIDVSTYLAGLRAVRDIEDHLEPLRRELGAPCSRAFELETGGRVGLITIDTPVYQAPPLGSAS
jgi:hypothetical protein